MRRQITVDIIGMINDHKFTVEGSGEVDSDRGEARLTLNYSSVPPGWHPRLYSDPLVLLAAYREMEEGKNFQSLSGEKLLRFYAVSTIDFTMGLLVRKTAEVWLDPDDIWHAKYALFGTCRVGEVISVRPYEEHLIPIDDPDAEDHVMGIGYAIWDVQGAPVVQALISTRYRFVGGIERRLRQTRGFQVRIDLSEDRRQSRAEYSNLNIAPLRGAVRKD